MTWDDVAKIFNLEGPFESGREETSKRPNDAAKFYTYSYITTVISDSKTLTYLAKMDMKNTWIKKGSIII